MRMVELGKDKIPAIAIGTWSWGTGINGGNKVFGNSYGTKELLPVFKCGIKNGLTLWDTAAVYGMGAAESILGKCIEKCNDVIISTKFTPIFIQSKKAMNKSFHNSVRRLNHGIDIYWIHNASNVKKWTKQAVELYKAGEIKHIGVSNHNLEQIQEASEILEANHIHLDAVQNHYSLIYRQVEENGILEWCKKNNTRFFAYMLLEQGALTGKYNEANPFKNRTRRAKAFPAETLRKLGPFISCMQTIADNYGFDVSQVVIAWALTKGVIPLVGATKVYQIENISKSDEINLKKEEIELIEQAALKTGVSVKAGWES
jgi:Predicted oxidoreductases (related to aryl-alcohol dehydrogenases)